MDAFENTSVKDASLLNPPLFIDTWILDDDGCGPITRHFFRNGKFMSWKQLTKYNKDNDLPELNM